MAIQFNDSKGSAQKDRLVSYQFVDGEQNFRLVGDLLARYVYWIKGENDKNIPFECLSFDRNAERFNNLEKDWVKEFYPDLKCGWSYAMQCIHNGELKVVNMKKKLFEQILQASKDGLGNPCDLQEGWDVQFRRVKTGAQKWNVEYQLQPLKCKIRPLTEDEMSLVENLKSMDDVMPRPTPDAQKELLDRIRDGAAEASNVDDEALENEFNVG